MTRTYVHTHSHKTNMSIGRLTSRPLLLKMNHMTREIDLNTSSDQIRQTFQGGLVSNIQGFGGI